MAKNSVAGLLTSVDDLFSTQESRDEAKLERVINLPPGEISDFPNHPFKVRMDEEMQQMAESVKEHGVLVNPDVILSIMQEEKPNQKEQIKIPKERISRYFAPGTPVQKIEDTIVKALELYRKRQRSLER